MPRSGLEISNVRSLEGKVAVLELQAYVRAMPGDVQLEGTPGISSGGEGALGGEDGGKARTGKREGEEEGGGGGVDKEGCNDENMDLPDGQFDEFTMGRDEVTDMVNQALTGNITLQPEVGNVLPVKTPPPISTLN